MHTESKLAAMGLVLPTSFAIPDDVSLPFSWVRRYGDVVYVSGHGPFGGDGQLIGPFGKVGAEVTLDEAYQSARQVGLAILASLKREIRELDNVKAWLQVRGMVNAAPGFTEMTAVINGFSDLIVELYGIEAGRHARTAVGVASLPYNIPVEIEAQVSIGYHL